MKKIYHLFTLFLLSIALPLAFAAKADVMEATFSNLLDAQAFCSQLEIHCQSIEPLGKLYLVHFEKLQRPDSGPRRGKGGDGDGGE